MNKSKIEWCDHTWNPVTGCRNGCSYCYANAMVKRFSGDARLNKMDKGSYSLVEAADGGEDLYMLGERMLYGAGRVLVYPFGFEPTFHKYRLDYPDKLKMGNNIFVGAMSDMFGAWVPDTWLDEVMEACRKTPVHNYLFLTKYPQRYGQYHVPDGENMWYGTTVTNKDETARVMYLPAGHRKFVSIEPLMEDIEPENNYLMFRCVDWVIIGAETGRRKGKTVPEWEWIRKILLEAGKNGVPVFMKDSLVPVAGEGNMCREFPAQLKNSGISPKMQEKLYGICCMCKARMRKSSMVTLLARVKRGKQPKQYGFMCRECFSSFCDSARLESSTILNMQKNKGSIDEEE